MQSPYPVDALIRYEKGADQKDMIAGPVTVETYRAFIDLIKDDDPATRRIMERIMKMDRERANDTAGRLRLKYT